MQTNFKPVHFTKIIFVFLITSFPHIIIPSESLERAKQNVVIAQEKVTKRFEAKLNQAQMNLEASITTLKTEPLYSTLEIAIQNLHKEPAYQLYILTRETHIFIEELENYNKVLIRPELLTKINNLLDALKTTELFSSLRSTLKKQRVALLELFEEKDLIISVEKILKYQNKELSVILVEQQKSVLALSSYQNAQEVQKKYLETKAVKNVLSCIEKMRETLLQRQNALLKNKEYQKALNAHELISFSRPASSEEQQMEKFTKKELLNLQSQLFIIPLENVL
jgi:hypothetical protein